jgi:nucleoside-diphosphate-sugar epimerase
MGKVSYPPGLLFPSISFGETFAPVQAQTPKQTYPHRVAILGCGFTGIRVARALLQAGAEVMATSRQPENLALPGARTVAFDASRDEDLAQIPILVEACDAIVCSIPTLRLNGQLVERVPELIRHLQGAIPRVIYLSTTGVYGDQQRIDEHTQPKPVTPRELCRAAAEHSVLEGCRNPLVLRPAAIYGPGRGVHVSLREGKYRLTGGGSNYISRIHVDDLAAHVLAALRGDVTGAWPVADEHPCSQHEMASFCAELLGLPMPPQVEPATNAETLRANRRVDGSAIRRCLGVSLRYPSYREGVPASLAAE